MVKTLIIEKMHWEVTLDYFCITRVYYTLARQLLLGLGTFANFREIHHLGMKIPSYILHYLDFLLLFFYQNSIAHKWNWTEKEKNKLGFGRILCWRYRNGSSVSKNGRNCQNILKLHLSSVFKIFHIWSSSFDCRGMFAASIRPSWLPSLLILSASGSILFFSSSKLI